MLLLFDDFKGYLHSGKLNYPIKSMAFILILQIKI